MGYSTETALHATVSFIEEQLERGGYAVGTFLDIEGAFNKVHKVVCEEALHRGVPEKLVEWIRSMLGRRVVASLGTTRVSGGVERGCPQGGVLSPLLWCLVMDGLLEGLSERGFFVQGYADDVALLVREPFLGPLLELMQNALGTVERWCKGTGLSVNPLKTGLVVFTRKYKVGTIKGPIFEDTRLAPAESVKYLGVILDKKLSWREHLESRSVLWWPRARKKAAVVALEHIRALILRGALGAMRTTLVAAMGILLGIEPLHQVVVGAAAIAAHRLACHRDADEIEPGAPVQAWDGDVWFTDGSKTGTSSGAGIVCRQRRVAESLLLDGYATVFQTEIVAILRCAHLALKVRETGGRVRICSDSQAAIKALEAPIYTLRLVWDCRNALEKLAKDKEVIVIPRSLGGPIPGHSGIEGNEEADRLARAASRMEVFGPGPVLGVPFCLGRERLRAWLRNEHLEFWKNELRTKCRQAGALLEETPSEGLVRDIRSLSRRDARIVVQILTGHGALNYNMHRLGRSDTAECRACREEEETSLHILCDCPAYAGLRLKLLGSAFPKPGQISRLPMRDLKLECLALVWSLKKWHTLLLGRQVRVYTNHRALQFLSTCVQNNTRIARWFSFLQEFDLDIIHILGKDNAITDTLSRNADVERVLKDNEKYIGLIRSNMDGTETND
ncbi:uncharacterized protein LOC113003211 [Solenopsis invicta]|uniref:uncharacterized protein LOC113003211 n=1 Tax=Solenopsis invicta TaxID=13686 RepID=UPI00193E77F3|nr:uncharacterized protein LOC113003211 [Solenopsis invicta]